ncbi:8090_t:CDS:2, partial [Racocetra fulgida]
YLDTEEGNRLEKRLEKLAKVYATHANPENNPQGGLKPPLSMMHRRRASEQSIVKWEDDASVTNCPLCESQEIVNQTHADYQLAARTRKELLDNFAQFDSISKKINSLLSRSKSEKRLQANIHLAANQYLQQNMLPLKVLPKLLKKDHDNEHEYDYHHESSPDMLLSVFENGRTRTISTSSTKSVKGEEKIREQLEVLLEQEKLVQGYIVEATKQRKFDDVKTLKTSLDELKVEINKTRKELGDLWA